jgi:hypothetical protein
MSLPEAHKEISAHPGKMSVTSPTDKAVMEADVDRKVRTLLSLRDAVVSIVRLRPHFKFTDAPLRRASSS